MAMGCGEEGDCENSLVIISMAIVSGEGIGNLSTDVFEPRTATGN